MPVAGSVDFLQMDIRDGYSSLVWIAPSGGFAQITLKLLLTMALVRLSTSVLSYVPHGHCYLWQTGLVSLHALSDGLIALSYYLIAVALIYFAQRRQDIPFRGLFWLFAAFIGFCGTTHAFEVWTLWVPSYWISGIAKALTALVSFWTALELIPRIPLALAMASPKQLEELNQSLAQEVTERKAAESAVHQLNEELEQRVAQRTQELEQAQTEVANLLEKEQAARQQVESTLEDLQTTAERLNIALSAAQMGSWDRDVAQDRYYWSPKTYEILDIPADMSIPEAYALWRQRVHPADLPQVEAAIAQSRQTQHPLVADYRIWRSDGSLRWILTQGRVLVSVDGQPRRMIGVVQDTTDAKQAELALRASEARFRAVFEQAAVGMARLSPAGHWLQVNHTLCEILGYAPEELVGQHFRAVTDPADHAQDAHFYDQLLHTETTSVRFEKRYLHKDGTPIWTVATVSTEQTDDGQVAAFIAVIEDIRALKQAQIELEERATELQGVNGMLAMTNALLEQRNAELDQFAYVASHDLKAPLRAIANLSEWIEEDLGAQLPAENQHQLSLLRSRVHRMEALINGLLEYSRVGRRERRIETVDVRQLLSEILDSLAPPSTFTVSVPDTLPHLQTNRIALSQIFANLLSNAIKHHDRDEGNIWISAQDQDATVEFAVRDDGPGIAPQYHEKVFTIFQTLKARDEFESTGIGLSVVRKIIEAEGGRIWLESAPGEGTTFYFTWPQ